MASQGAARSKSYSDHPDRRFRLVIVIDDGFLDVFLCFGCELLFSLLFATSCEPDTQCDFGRRLA